MPGRLTYDLLYGVGAARWSLGWDRGTGPELVALVRGGRVTPEGLAPGRAVDLGCGSGANVLFLARHGFLAVGVDISPVAIGRGVREASRAGLAGRARFVVGDATAERIPGAEGPFDLVVSYNTLQDLRGRARSALARSIARLTRPGGYAIVWCHQRDPRGLPVYSFRGPSRLLPYVVAPGEERVLFSDAFDVERLPEPDRATGTACFLLTRR